MEGLRSPLKQIVSLSKEFNALTYLDEVHSVGLYGSEGRGIANEQGVSDEIDIINGTLSKAFGQMGGYVAASSDIIDFIRSFAPGFIFTSSAPFTAVKYICPVIFPFFSPSKWLSASFTNFFVFHCVLLLINSSAFSKI